MKKTSLEFWHEWSARKEEIMRRDIIVFLRQMGAKDPKWIGTEEELEQPKLFVHLKCTGCALDWYAEVFEPCRTCGRRDTVEKAEAGRVPLPPPADAPQTAA